MTTVSNACLAELVKLYESNSHMMQYAPSPIQERNAEITSCLQELSERREKDKVSE